MEMSEKSARASIWVRIGIYLLLMSLIFLPIFPGVWDVLRGNLSALGIMQCEQDQWGENGIGQADAVDITLWARICPISLEDEENSSALESAFTELPQSPLLAAQYSRLYWEMGLRDPAFQQLSIARKGSGSMRLTAYLMGTNLDDAAFEGYVANRWWSPQRVCNEIKASAESTTSYGSMTDLLTYCENYVP